jgi:chorismate synthase
MANLKMGAGAIIVAMGGLSFVQYLYTRRQLKLQAAAGQLVLRRVAERERKARHYDDDNSSVVSTTSLQATMTTPLTFSHNNKKQSSKGANGRKPKYGPIPATDTVDEPVDFSHPM